jgi:hypothetical protein
MSVTAHQFGMILLGLAWSVAPSLEPGLVSDL